MTSQLSAEDLRSANEEDLTVWEQEWRDYFIDHPEVLASWGHQNNRRAPRKYRK